MNAKIEKNNIIERPPVIAIMGHIDHGKSSLLDHIRDSNIVEKEYGGITQHVSAYEVVHKTKDGGHKKITFLDTPGHEAFTAIRSRGASVADIVVLVVAANDGVKTQTLEALKVIKESKTPFVIAINKIDLPESNVERAKTDLVENEIYIEGYGGDIPAVPISAKTGAGVPELLDMMLLIAELEELKGDPTKNGEGVVIEANLDRKKGVSATLVIKNGTIKQGMFIVCGDSIAPIRIMEDFLGKKISEATFSSPIKIIGFNKLPKVGLPFKAVASKKEAEAEAATYKEVPALQTSSTDDSDKNYLLTLPIIIKADVSGTLDAVIHEIEKIQSERVHVRIIASEAGTINEKDVKTLASNDHSLIIGFNTSVDPGVQELAERNDIEIQVFDIIYKLSDWLKEKIETVTPKVATEITKGSVKILKIFSKTKEKQVVGGRVETGKIAVGDKVRIMRRDENLGTGKVLELQEGKVRSKTIEEGSEFGTLIESEVDIMQGDVVEPFKVEVI
jgi:translation initiation factor IF-2